MSEGNILNNSNSWALYIHISRNLIGLEKVLLFHKDQSRNLWDLFSVRISKD